MSRRRKNSCIRKTLVERVHKHDWKHDIKVDQDYVCSVCGLKGSESSLQIHHCKNKCRGGGNTRENCCAVHVRCHRLIHDRYGNNFHDPRQV